MFQQQARKATRKNRLAYIESEKFKMDIKAILSNRNQLKDTIKREIL